MVEKMSQVVFLFLLKCQSVLKSSNVVFMKKCSTNFAWIQISKLHEQCILLKWGSWSIPIIKQYQRHQLPSLRIEEALLTSTLTLLYLCEILYWWAGNSSQTHHWTRMSRGLLVTYHQLDASEMHQRPLYWRAEADWRCLCHEARLRLLVMLGRIESTLLWQTEGTLQ